MYVPVMPVSAYTALAFVFGFALNDGNDDDGRNRSDCLDDAYSGRR